MRFARLIFSVLLTSRLAAQVVGEATFCENVISLNAVNPKTQFASGQKAYLWMRINEATPGSSISIEWIYNQHIEHTTKLHIGYPSMRTYAFKTLVYDGMWTAVVRASDGRELKRLTCVAGSGSAVTANTASSVSQTTQQSSPAGNVSTSTGSPGNVAKSDAFPKPASLTLDPSFKLVVEEKCKILKPANIQPGKIYPVLVFLPPTSMSAEGLFEHYAFASGSGGANALEALMQGLFPDKQERLLKEFFVLLPAGTGSEDDHSWQGFHACIHRYEQRVLADVRSLAKAYNIDTTRVVLTGYSLGGDLSWAIAHRHPYSFKGGIISGSRLGYHEPGKLDHLARHKARFYLAMGELESETRKTVFDQTRQLLDKHDVEYRSVTIRGGEHAPMLLEQFRQGINFVMFDETK